MPNKIILILLGILVILILIPKANATTFKFNFNNNEFSNYIDHLNLNTTKATYGQTIEITIKTKKSGEEVSLTFSNGTNRKVISLIKTSKNSFSGKMKITSSFAQGEYKLDSIKFNHQNLVISDKKINFTIIDLPIPTIEQVTNQSTTLKGEFLPNSEVEIYKDSLFFNTVKTNDKGEFNNAIKPLKEFTKISIIGVSEGIKSKPISLIVKDSIAPSITSLSTITDQSQNVTGISEPFATVKVFMNDNLIGNNTVSSTGKFTVKIGKQKANSILKVIVLDQSNNQSKPFTLRVSHYISPVVSTVKNNSTLSAGQLLIINTKTNKLTFYRNGNLVKTFTVATGKSSTPTPTGKFVISNKVKNRPWYKGNIRGGDPRNPLGNRWLGLSVGAAYGIHGNNKESSIGQSVSSGCVRMHNSEIQWLFEQVNVGTTVIIANSSNSNGKIASSYGISIA
ncbi:L,D-transpeptidase family protein [Gottfriedia acidiceleris]|uniref:L,D-transpeptidase family protein n=1 Tax=Bacillaceae TaxID=186817 RepID=UPI001596DBF6|nr:MULTISPECIES: L,D-transpeptidase family protein [unclassified Bacillus (in: firmicutes)]